jgi:hypothetical protein
MRKKSGSIILTKLTIVLLAIAGLQVSAKGVGHHRPIGPGTGEIKITQSL